MQHELEYVIFGHIGDAHVHVNILPRSPAEFEAGPAFDAAVRTSRGKSRAALSRPSTDLASAKRICSRCNIRPTRSKA